MKYLNILIILLLHSGLLVGQSCDLEGILYHQYEDVKILLDNKGCISCHSTTSTESSWRYSTYENMFTTGECGDPIITHGDASTSLLYDKINGGQAACGEPMPTEGATLTKQEVYFIEEWINHGATENCVPFYENVTQVLAKYSCNSCHTSASSWSYLSYAHMTGLSSSNTCDNLVEPYSATNSVLYDVISKGASECIADNSGHGVIAEEDVKIIRDWINGGAQEGIFALPVELIDFDLDVRKDNRVELIWETASEISTDRFVVQRSRNGYVFTTVGEVSSTGDFLQGDNYIFADKESYFGLGYYRLLIIDTDGSFSYSNIISTRVEPNDDILTVTPNLLSRADMLQITWHSRVERTAALGSLVNAMGQEVKRVRLTEGQNNITLPPLESGLYYLIVEDFFDSYQLARFLVVE